MFAKVFDVKRYGQIVVIKRQNDEGTPELKFYFQPEGCGVCDFSIGWKQDVDEEVVAHALKSIIPREAIEIVDGYVREMQSAQRGLN